MQPTTTSHIILPGLPRSRSQEHLATWYPQTRPKSCTHFELEFDNPSSVCARRLFAVVARESSGNGKSASSRSIVYSPSHTTPTPPFASTTTLEQPPHTQRSSSPLAAESTYTNPPLCSSPERQRHRSREEVSLLCRVPEDSDTIAFHSMSVPHQGSQRNSEQADVENGRRQRSTATGSFDEPTSGYAAVQSSAAEDSDEEEEEWILDEELALQGLYRGSYLRLIGLYTLTPAFTLLVFLSLAYLPRIAYPLPLEVGPHDPYHYAPYLPFPLPEFFTATAFWALSHLLNSPIFSFFSFIFSPSSIPALCLSSLAQGAIVVVLRQAVIPILLIPQNVAYDHPTWYDPAFRRVWWVALGWAAAEAVVGIKQGYEGIALYRDVLVSIRRVASTPKQNIVRMSGYGSINHENLRGRAESQRAFPGEDAERQQLLERRPSVVSSIAAHSDDAHLREAIEEEVERDVDELIALRGRDELEKIYGMPFIHIPVFISCLHRFNSALFILGSTLLLTAAYMTSTFSLTPPPRILGFLFGFSPSALQERSLGSKSNDQLLITLPMVLSLQWLFGVLHSPQLLPYIGIQTFVYIGFMVSLGVFFAGLGVWEGIV